MLSTRVNAGGKTLDAGKTARGDESNVKGDGAWFAGGRLAGSEGGKAYMGTGVRGRHRYTEVQAMGPTTERAMSGYVEAGSDGG